MTDLLPPDIVWDIDDAASVMAGLLAQLSGEP
jgi:hypothetical protein